MPLWKYMLKSVHNDIKCLLCACVQLLKHNLILLILVSTSQSYSPSARSLCYQARLAPHSKILDPPLLPCVLISDNRPLIKHLENEVQLLIDCSRRDITRRTYDSAQRQYPRFCEMYKLQSVPCNQEILLLYVAFLI